MERVGEDGAVVEGGFGEGAGFEEGLCGLRGQVEEVAVRAGG